MGSFLSSGGSLPTCLQSDLDATMVDVGACTRRILSNQMHVLNSEMLGVHKVIPEAHGDYVRILAWDCINFRRGRIISGGGDGRICIWDEDTFQKVGLIEVRASVRSLLVTPGCFLSGHSDGQVVVWDARLLTEVTRLEGHEEAVYALVYLPSINCVISGAEQIHVWEKDSLTFRWLVCLHQEVLCAAVTGSWLFTGQMNKEIGVWDIPTNGQDWDTEASRQLTGHSRSVWSMAVDESSGVLVSGSADSKMMLWKLPRKTFHGEEVRDRDCWTCFKVVSFDSWVVNLSFGATKLLSASNDGALKIWDTKDWKLEKSFQMDGELYCCLVFGEGNIVCGGQERSIIVYREGSTQTGGSNLDKTFIPLMEPRWTSGQQVYAKNGDSSGSGSTESRYRLPKSPPMIDDDRIRNQSAAASQNPFEFTISEFQIVQPSKRVDRGPELRGANSSGELEYSTPHGKEPDLDKLVDNTAASSSTSRRPIIEHSIRSKIDTSAFIDVINIDDILKPNPKNNDGDKPSSRARRDSSITTWKVETSGVDSSRRYSCPDLPDRDSPYGGDTLQDTLIAEKEPNQNESMEESRQDYMLRRQRNTLDINYNNPFDFTMSEFQMVSGIDKSLDEKPTKM